MKKLILAAMISSLLVGCGGDDNNSNEGTPTPPPVVDPAPDLDVDGDFGVDHEPEVPVEPDTDLPPDENTDDDFGVDHGPEEPDEPTDPDFGLDHGGDDAVNPDLPGDDGQQIFDPAVNPDWIKQANDVSFDKTTGYITGVVAGKNAIGETASALISVPVKKGTTLSQYDVEWEIDSIQPSHMNIYLSCEGVKESYAMMQDGTVEVSGGVPSPIHYDSYASFKADKSACQVTEVYPDALLLQKGNFIWRSSSSHTVMAGDTFTVKKFNVVMDPSATIPDEYEDPDFGVDHPVDVDAVVDVSLIKQANDISVDTTTGYVSGVVKGTSALGSVSPALIAPVIQADTTLSQYDVEWESETITTSYMAIKLDCDGKARKFAMNQDGTVDNAPENVGGNKVVHNTFSDFKSVYGSCKVTLSYPGDLILKKSNFIWSSSQNSEVVAGATFTIKKFNVTFTAE